MAFYPPNVESLLKLALEEDLGQGDVLGESLQSCLGKARKRFQIVPRQACLVSGLKAVETLIRLGGFDVQLKPFCADGASLSAFTPIAELDGLLLDVLALERTALNVLQHLSGVATLTHAFVQAVEGTSTKIVHTRKTLGGWRFLQQQAVLHGGGNSHRYNLSHTAMLKDNLIQSLEMPLEAVTHLVRQRLPHTAKLEIECDTLEQIPLALKAQAQVILLDNMTLDDIQEAVTLIAGRAVVEVSGGITLANVKAYAQAGVDVISTSQITMAAPPIDIGLDTL
jgi:nicotinate-nucleotide pyrophosphorylase (carboxylating)